RIRDDYALFRDVCNELESPSSPQPTNYHSLAPAELHGELRAAMLPRHDWLNEPEPKRITLAENLADWGRAIIFGLGVLLALSSPGLRLAALLPWKGALAVMIVATLVLSGLISRDRHALEGKEIKTRSNTLTFTSTFLLGQYPKFLIAAAIYVIGASIVLD